MNASIMMMEAAIAGDHDGIAFGLVPGQRTSCFRLTLHAYENRQAKQDKVRVGSVQIQTVDAAGNADHAGSIVSGLATVLETAAADFGDRLEAKGHDRGKMPEAGGTVHLHTQFGRELVVLGMAASCHSEVVEACRLWSEATPAWRLQLYWRATHDVERRTIVYPEDRVRQELLEDLRLRAPDGSKDLARENRVLGPRQQVSNQLRAIQFAQREKAARDRKVLGRGAHDAAT